MKVKKVCGASSSTPPRLRLSDGKLSLVHRDWNAVCQAIDNCGDGAEWENMYYKFVQMNKEVNDRHTSGSSRVRTLWMIGDPKKRGLYPTLALAEALRRVEVWDDAGSSMAGESRT